jgi:hypothetical protein
VDSKPPEKSNIHATDATAAATTAAEDDDKSDLAPAMLSSLTKSRAKLPNRRAPTKQGLKAMAASAEDQVDAKIQRANPALAGTATNPQATATSSEPNLKAEPAEAAKTGSPGSDLATKLPEPEKATKASKPEHVARDSKVVQEPAPADSKVPVEVKAPSTGSNAPPSKSPFPEKSASAASEVEAAGTPPVVESKVKTADFDDDDDLFGPPPMPDVIKVGGGNGDPLFGSSDDDDDLGSIFKNFISAENLFR